MTIPMTIPVPTTPRAAFRAFARELLTTRVTAEQAFVLQDIYDAIPSPNCIDKLLYRVCVYKSMKDVDGHRRRENLQPTTGVATVV